MQGAPESTALVSLGALFTLLFIMLGPLKLLGPFVQMTRELDEAAVKGIGVRAFVLAAIAVVAGGFIGETLAENWSISITGLLLAGGLIFFLVGLQVVLEEYKPANAAPAPLPPAPLAAAMRVAFPAIVTPYGIATVLVLQVLGAVLGVLQVALAVEIILRALDQLGVFDG